MQQSKERINRKTQSAKAGNNRTLYVFLAGATFLVSGLVATATLMSPASLPFSGESAKSKSKNLPITTAGKVQSFPAALPSAKPAATTVALAQATASDNRAVAQSAQPVAVIAAKPTEVRTQEVAGNPIEAARPSKAEYAAKKTLAEKLAALKLARVLLAAQSAQRDRTVDTAAAPQVTVAEAPAEAKPAPASPSGNASIAVASLEQPVEASLAPVKPGAIVPRTPAVKPEPPRQAQAVETKPVVANRDGSPKNEKPEVKSPVLAYANPGNPEDDENGVFGGIGKLFGGGKGGLPGPGSKIAVYDISTATVHMPDGTKLEAHSGIGSKMDNPKYTHVRMGGPTPPNVYKLRMRESLFHGVEAIRMLPQDRAAMKGRDGMLTHTRLLRSSIGSHGCVAFKNYNKFLNAFKSGKVKTLIVVPSMNKLPTYMAKLEQSRGA